MNHLPWGSAWRCFEHTAQLVLLYVSINVFETVYEAFREHKYAQPVTQYLIGCSRNARPDNLGATWEVLPLDVYDPDNFWVITVRPLGKMYLSGNPGLVELFRDTPFEKSGREPPPRTTNMGKEDWGLYMAPELTCNDILRNAVFHGHIRMLEYLFNLGFDVYFESTASAKSLLATAAGAFQTTAVKWLLQHDAPVNDEWAVTKATKAGSLEIVRMLVCYGADVRVGSPLPIISA